MATQQRFISLGLLQTLGVAALHQIVVYHLPTIVAPSISRLLYKIHFWGSSSAADSINYFFSHLAMFSITAGLFVGAVGFFSPLRTRFIFWVWILPVLFFVYRFGTTDLGLFSTLGGRF